MLPVNVIVNVNVTAEFRWHVRLAFYLYVYYKRLRTTFLARELSFFEWNEITQKSKNPVNFGGLNSVTSQLNAGIQNFWLYGVTDSKLVDSIYVDTD